MASLENLDWDGLMDIYAHFFAERLPPPDIALELRRATLVISNAGFSIEIDHLAIGHFLPASGELTIGPGVFKLNAKVHGDFVVVSDFRVTNPAVEISCTRAAGAKKTNIVLSGGLTWEGHAL